MKVRDEKIKRGFKKWAETEAEKFRSKLSLMYYDRLPAKTLANHLHVKTISPHDIKGLLNKEREILLNHDSSSWSAITIKDSKGKLIIIYNPTHSEKRQESNLMHELSHIICNHKMEKIRLRKDFPFPLRDYDANQEDEAKWLGGCLQLPRKALVWGKFSGMNNDELSTHFCASMSMLKFRLNITGVERQIKHIW